MYVVPDSLFQDHCHAHYRLTTALSPEFIILSACRPGQLPLFSSSGPPSRCLVAILSALSDGKEWEKQVQDGAKRRKILVEHPSPQYFTSSETQFQEE